VNRLGSFLAIWMPVVGVGYAAPAVEPKFPLGRETTYVDGPLDDEGFVDYAEALNDHYGRGVKPENNVHAQLWKALGPGPVPKEVRAKYFQRLGIDAPPEKETYFVTFESFVRTWNSDAEPASQRDGDQTPKDQLVSAFSRPWKADEFPVVAAWLKANEAPPALMDDVVKRSEYFRPVVVPVTSAGRGNLLEAPISGTFELFDIARAFAARAMLRTAEGRHAEAWNDLMRCHRLGRLAARGPFLIDLLIGYSIDNMAAAADIRYLAHRKWTAESASAHAADLDRLPSMPPLAEKFDLGERFQYLDAVRQIRRGGLDAVQRLGGTAKPDNPELFEKLMATIDYGPALRSGNRWYDRLARAAQLKEPAKRLDELRQIDLDLKTLAPTGPLSRAGFWLGLAAGTPSTRGERIGDMAVMLLLPSLSTAGRQENRSVQQVRNVKIALGLAAFRADTGRYPSKLDELVPNYLAEVPRDLFADKPPIYRAVDQGYLLYSVGPDGEDDEGRSYYEDREQGFDRDDVSIRMSIPLRTSAKE